MVVLFPKSKALERKILQIDGRRLELYVRRELQVKPPVKVKLQHGYYRGFLAWKENTYGAAAFLKRHHRKTNRSFDDDAVMVQVRE